MVLMDDVADFFIDSITVTRKTADGWGTVSGSASVTADCRISNKVNRVLGANGEEATSSLMATFGSVPVIAGEVIKTTDEYLLPIRFTPRKPIAKSVQVPTDENGSLFVRVYF